MDAWAVLGLDPGEADPAAIKRAYAAQLKLHRPDQDPEGFRRVREAYQALIFGLANDAAPSRQITVAPAPAEPVAPAPPTVAASGPPEDFVAATAAWREGRLLLEAWQEAAMALAAKDLDAMTDVLTADDLVAEGMRGDGRVGEAVTLAWRFSRRWDELEAFARRWIAEGDAATDGSRLDACLGCTFAVREPELAARFAQRLFQRRRDDLLPELEARSAFASDVGFLTVADRRVVADILDADPKRVDIALLRAARRVAESLPFGPAKDLLRARIGMAERRTAKPMDRLRAARSRGGDEATNAFPWQLILTALLIGIGYCLWVASTDAPRPPPQLTLLPNTELRPSGQVLGCVQAVVDAQPDQRERLFHEVLAGERLRADDPGFPEVLLRLAEDSRLDDAQRIRCLTRYAENPRPRDADRIRRLGAPSGSDLGRAVQQAWVASTNAGQAR